MGDPWYHKCKYLQGRPCTVRPSGSLEILLCQEFPLALLSDVLIISLPNLPAEFISVTYFQTVHKQTLVSAAVLPTTLLFIPILTSAFATITNLKRKVSKTQVLLTPDTCCKWEGICEYILCGQFSFQLWTCLLKLFLQNL